MTTLNKIGLVIISSVDNHTKGIVVMNKRLIVSTFALAALLSACKDSSSDSVKVETDKVNDSIKNVVDDGHQRFDDLQHHVDNAVDEARQKVEQTKDDIKNKWDSKIHDGTKEIEIGPQLVDCQGGKPMHCLSVKGADINNGQLYYSAIEGFNFEPGYNYKLKVKKLNKTVNPKDDTIPQWTLVQVVKKEPVKK
jgi:gas vesicle protein